MKKTTYAFVALIFLLNSCELETKEPEPIDTTPFVPTALNVLNDNSGFSIIYDSAYSKTQLSGGASGNIGLWDFSITNNNQLHALYSTSRPTQQSTFTTNYEIGVDFSNNTLLSYKEYDNTMFNLNEKKPKYFQNSDVLIHECIINQINTKYGIQPVPSFRNPVEQYGSLFGISNSANFTKSNAKFKYFYVPFTDLPKNDYDFRKAIKADVFNNNGTEEYYTTIFSKDSIKLCQTTIITEGNATIATVTQTETVFSMPVDYTNSINFQVNLENYKYSNDGKTVSVLLHNTLDNKFYTYKINFETKNIVNVLNDVSLEYAGNGSDIDIDENGYIYYTGTAGNGSNSNGVSIYKKTGTNSPAIVGADNFLKSGQVVGLKHLNGKVYLAVTASQVGVSVHQISFLKQN